jgi:hypothetical protein
MKHFFTSRVIACLAFLALLWPLASSAAPFTPGNLVVVRVGDGSATLTSAATATFLVEYTPSGTLVQTVALPVADAGANQTLTISGTSTADGQLTRSVDGAYLVLAGYDAAPGTAAIAGTTAAAVNRIVGRVAADGTINATTTINDAFSSGNFRSAATADGQSFYGVGSVSGVRYVTLGNTGTSTAISTGTPTNLRFVNIAGGNLYVSSASGTTFGVAQVGSGVPTTTGQTITPLPGFPTTTGPSSYAFYFADLSTTVAGPDVVYVADDRSTVDGGIQKWSLVGGTWTLNGTIGGLLTAQLRGLSGSTTGTTVSLAASGAGGLFFVTDNAGYNVAPSTTALPAAVAMPGANAAFRGVAFAPVGNTTTPVPTITSIAPTTGAIGSTVTITGTNLTGATLVTLNGTSVTGFTVVNNTTITFVVPTGATSGNIGVTTPGGTATSSGSFTVTVAAPTITSFTPTSGVVGATVTITGTNFTGATALTLNGAAVTGFTVVNATTITFVVPTGATSGTIAVTTPGGTATSATSFTVTVPAPTITSFTPTSGNVGATVTITGTNFTGATALTLNGAAVTGFTVVNATTITFTVPAGATSGTVAVTTPGGTATSTGTFTVTVPPTITSFTPTSGVVGATVTLTGTNFTGATALTLNGVVVTSFTVVNATTITFTVPAGATSGTIAVTTPGGTATSTGTFTVTSPNPVPTITSLSPSTVVAGAGAFTLLINGTGFLPTSTVSFAGTVIASTYVSSTQLSVALPAGAVAGTYAVVVTSPTPGGGASNTSNFVVTPAPTITSLSPNTAVAGGASFLLTVTGSNFTASSVINFNGVALATTLVSATQLTATVPASAITTAGTMPVTITTSGTGGTTSPAVNFTVTVPAPTITSFTPTSGVVGATVTITGTNFTGATALTLNGAAVTGFTVVNATTITFVVPTGATSGTIAVTTPGGTATSTGTFTVTPAVPVPTITSFSPARAVTGVGFTLTVNGTGLVAGTTITFNGNTYTGTILGTSGTGYTVVIPASGVPAPGTYNITATNGGGASAPLSFLVVAASTSTAFEDFEQGTKGGYATGTVTLRSGAWTFTDALLGNLFNDKVNQIQSARVRGGGTIFMNFDKPNGAGIVTLQAAMYGSDTPAVSFTLEVSTDGGTTYSVVPGAPAALTTTLTTYSFTVNRPGNVRLRISSTNTTVGSNPRINIDDLNIADFIGSGTREANQAQLSLYPNPATDVVTVQVTGSTAGLPVQVSDLLGRVVRTATLPASGQLSLRGLPSGTYLLTVDGKLTRRITKE